MSWAQTRREVERITHAVFAEPATFRSPAGDARVVLGVLTQRSEATTLPGDVDVGYEAAAVVYELRKDTEDTQSPPLTVDDFPAQGTLTLDTGAAFVVMYAVQTDTLIVLGLAPVEL